LCTNLFFHRILSQQNQAGRRRVLLLPHPAVGRRAVKLPAMDTTGGAQRPHTLRDLAEEGKKRAVLLLVFAFGLAFLMSREYLSNPGLVQVIY
jgi:hypothetical protein